MTDLQHHGNLAQVPFPQETQRHGFSCPVAAHQPLEICRFCHRFAIGCDHDIQPLELSAICWSSGADLQQFHAKLLVEMQPLSQGLLEWHAHPAYPQ